MSAFHGPQHKGAMRAHREQLRKEAALRQNRTLARRLIDAAERKSTDTARANGPLTSRGGQVADTGGPTIPDAPSSTPERTSS